MMLRGHICSLRAVEPEDLELLCRWENDPSLWTVSGTIEPFSHYSIEQFIQEQQAGIYRCGQLRLMIDDTAGETIGAIDLFDFEPQHERAGVGILVYDRHSAGKDTGQRHWLCSKSMPARYSGCGNCGATYSRTTSPA